MGFIIVLLNWPFRYLALFLRFFIRSALFLLSLRFFLSPINRIQYRRLIWCLRMHSFINVFVFFALKCLPWRKHIFSLWFIILNIWKVVNRKVNIDISHFLFYKIRVLTIISCFFKVCLNYFPLSTRITIVW
jgi:hypothetical protein